jgi:hypothetical protein
LDSSTPLAFAKAGNILREVAGREGDLLSLDVLRLFDAVALI